MIIKNARIFGEDGRFHPGTARMEHGRFSFLEYLDDITPAFNHRSNIQKKEQKSHQINDGVLDAAGLYMIPGLVDIHFHGCAGADFSDGTEEAIARMAVYEAGAGITSICPATMTIAPDELFRVMEAARSYSKNCNPKGARLVGINMEGPFISPEKKGAQDASHIRACDVSFFQKLQKAAGGQIKLVDIAPEETHAMDFIEQLHDKVVISLAHSTADYECACQAFSLGARHVTHLYNAMPAFGHRSPGIVGAALDHKNCMVELICDGIHVHPSVVRATFQMFGKERIILISDSIRATGLSDGTYTLGGQEVSVKNGRATQKDGTIAGSTSTLMDCVKYAVLEIGIPIEDAILCATTNPAKEIGIFDECGSICPGKRADFVLLDEAMEIQGIFMEGQRIY